MALLSTDLSSLDTSYALVILKLKHKLCVRLAKLFALADQLESFLCSEFFLLN